MSVLACFHQLLAGDEASVPTTAASRTPPWLRLGSARRYRRLSRARRNSGKRLWLWSGLRRWHRRGRAAGGPTIRAENSARFRDDRSTSGIRQRQPRRSFGQDKTDQIGRASCRERVWVVVG